MITIPHINTRYYYVRPENKSVETCRSHGADHGAYGWNSQLDPRWSEEQKMAYIEGYRSTCSDKRRPDYFDTHMLIS